ncbi:unnamed protein product [Paramecium sonneborni]|uniref:Uncharacterized protein n=1 Tax=Paramecium sonneborni TaxID=65129 RepID=A0A8S1M7N5_9CILI|nr:unnamed protein product [Paramecium sonneborni]
MIVNGCFKRENQIIFINKSYQKSLKKVECQESLNSVNKYKTGSDLRIQYILNVIKREQSVSIIDRSVNCYSKNISNKGFQRFYSFNQHIKSILNNSEQIEMGYKYSGLNQVKEEFRPNLKHHILEQTLLQRLQQQF